MSVGGNLGVNKTMGDKLSRKESVWKSIRFEYDLYLLLIVPLIFIFVFKILPMAWLLIGFQDYNIFAGLKGSEWVGLKHFETMLRDEDFIRVVRNTLVISIYRFVALFPLPIIVALMLNELRIKVFKRTVQTVMYLPHFISWVVAGAMIINVLQYNGGLVNEVLLRLGLEPVNFLARKDLFRTLLVISAGWKDVGWNSIIYLAAITSVDPTLYESAEIDGAGRFRKMWSITITGISDTIVVLMLIRIGYMMASNMDQVLMLYNPVVYETGDVIDTYVYRQGIAKMDYSFPSAVGLFNSLVNFLLLFFANTASKRLLGKSLW